MKWIESTPDIHSRDVSILTRRVSVIDALKLLMHAKYYPFVIFEEDVHQAVIAHLSTKNVELGGLLTGHVYSTHDLHQGIVAVRITNAVACDNFVSTGVSLNMNSDVWHKANSSSTDGAFVIGWYHSHPNLGAFFSGTDRRTQNAFFKNTYSLGLVIDPIRNESKWFVGPDCIELPSNRILGDESGLEVV